MLGWPPADGGDVAFIDLVLLAGVARREGWATATESLGLPLVSLIGAEASRWGWTEVPTRLGDDPVSELRPTTQTQARPASLSAVHGLDEQPLHTDGAHLAEPPDIVVLLAEEPNSTPTLLWSASSKLVPAVPPGYGLGSALDAGLFLINSGSERFLGSARAGDTGLRYDPTCMTPCDQRARQAAAYFASVQAHAYRHEWTAKNQVLVIDNTKTLHARAAVADGDQGRVLHRLAFRSKAAS